jgi:hypothetical protein
MGEIQSQPTQLSFKACLKVDFQGSRATSDGSLILVRKLAELRTEGGSGEEIRSGSAGAAGGSGAGGQGGRWEIWEG